MDFTLLVCDDDEDISSAIEIYLTQEGYRVIKASDGLSAVRAARQHELHLILLDIMMPGMDGIRAMVKIREERNIPIILLSAKSEDTDKVLGLNMGADDYITKPFNPVELVARVRSQLRRYAALGGMHKEAPKAYEYRIGGIVLNDETKEVFVEEERKELTPIEFGILKLLLCNKNKVMSSKQIYEQVWGEPAFDVGRTISVHIRHLREKIEIDPKEPRYIRMVYGLGYKITEESV